MSDIVRARVLEHLGRLRLGHVAEQLDALLSDAARTEPTYMDFLDVVLREEVGAKQRKRVAMGIQIAHFPTVKTLEDFDFKFQPSVDQKLVRELAVGRYIAQAENVLVFGPPGVGKTHLAIALGRAAVEAGYSTLFTSATALLATLAKAETEGQLADRLGFYAKPKLLIVDELGYLPFEKRSAHLFFQLVARRYEKGSMLLTTNQVEGAAPRLRVGLNLPRSIPGVVRSWRLHGDLLQAPQVLRPQARHPVEMVFARQRHGEDAKGGTSRVPTPRIARKAASNATS